jgi:hypothetical protein
MDQRAFFLRAVGVRFGSDHFGIPFMGTKDAWQLFLFFFAANGSSEAERQ